MGKAIELSALEAALARVELTGIFGFMELRAMSAYPTLSGVSLVNRPRIRLRVLLRVPHRDTRELVAVIRDFELCGALIVGDLDAWIFRCAELVAIHEFRECYRVDGEIYYDPHRGESPTSLGG